VLLLPSRFWNRTPATNEAVGNRRARPFALVGGELQESRGREF